MDRNCLYGRSVHTYSANQTQNAERAGYERIQQWLQYHFVGILRHVHRLPDPCHSHYSQTWAPNLPRGHCDSLGRRYDCKYQ